MRRNCGTSRRAKSCGKPASALANSSVGLLGVATDLLVTVTSVIEASFPARVLP